MGHGPECRIRPQSPWVSRQHCLLQVSADHVRLRDLGSSNGTLLNGQRISEERTLQDGDLIEIGPVVLKIQLTASSEAPSATAH